MPRKYRNAEERVIIYKDIEKGLNDLQVYENPKVKPLIDHMELFVNEPTSLRQFDGVIEIPELGIKIEYILPGRRIIRHGVKVSRIEGGRLGGNTVAARATAAVTGNTVETHAAAAGPDGIKKIDRSSMPL